MANESAEEMYLLEVQFRDPGIPSIDLNRIQQQQNLARALGAHGIGS